MKTKIIIIFLFLSSIGFSQDAAKVLENLQTKFNEIEDFKAKFTQSFKNEFSKNSRQMHGVFFYKKGNKFRVEFENREIISDGESIWNYDALNDKVVINNISKDASSFTLDKLIYEYPSNCEVSSLPGSKGEYSHAIKLTSNSNDLGFKTVKIWLNNNYLIRKLEVSNFNNTQIVIELLDLKRNQNLKDSRFSFKPEEGTRTIDLR